jgi:hypothetical protein
VRLLSHEGASRPADGQRDSSGDQQKAAFVLNLDRDLASIACRQTITPDFGRRGGGCHFSGIDRLELEAHLITSETVSFPHVEVEARHWFLQKKVAAKRCRGLLLIASEILSPINQFILAA